MAVRSQHFSPERVTKKSKLEALLDGNGSTSVPVSSLLLDAKEAYTSKQYEKALKFYSQAIESGRDQCSDFVHLYELRSAVYVKLKQIGLALQDARKMVRLDRLDARGYIRCAQIEQMNNNHDSAVKFYEHGLKNVPKQAPSYLQLQVRLQRLKELMAKEVVFKKGTDPLQVLPLELLQMVLSYATYRQIVGILRVSKLWKNTLSSLDIVRETIDFRHSTTRTVSYTAVNAAIRRLGRKKKILVFSNVNNNTAQLLLTQLQKWVNWQSLEHLIVHSPYCSFNSLRWEKYNLKSVDFRHGAEMSAEVVSRILHTQRELQKADFATVDRTLDLTQVLPNENLEVLRITFKKLELEDLMLHIVFPRVWRFPNIQELTLRNACLRGTVDLSSCHRLTTLDIESSRTVDSDKFYGPRQLETLGIDESDLSSQTQGNPQPDNFSIHMQNVRNLRIAALHPAGLTLAGLADHGLEISKLKHLTLRMHEVDWPLGPHFDILGDVNTDTFDDLESLVFEDQGVMDTWSKDFSRFFPNIVSLDIDAPRLTGFFVAYQLRRKNSKLKSLVLRNCDKVGLDTADWARGRGVDVKIIRNNGRKEDGARVRYE